MDTRQVAAVALALLASACAVDAADEITGDDVDIAAAGGDDLFYPRGTWTVSFDSTCGQRTIRLEIAGGRTAPIDFGVDDPAIAPLSCSFRQFGEFHVTAACGEIRGTPSLWLGLDDNGIVADANVLHWSNGSCSASICSTLNECASVARVR